MGSIDQSLALVYSFTPATSTTQATNTIDTENGNYTITYKDPLAGLSETFRPDLAGSALIDIQGSVQSIRGDTAKGMVLNDTGNLNLVKFRSLTDSSIVGQPIGHLQIPMRSDNKIMSSKRDIKGRNGVKVDKHLETIGPLSQPNNYPVADF